MMTDDGLTLRRTWPYPLAVGVRGIVLEVDASTGDVPRMGPLGVALPTPPPVVPTSEPASEPAASDPQPEEGS